MARASSWAGLPSPAVSGILELKAALREAVGGRLLHFHRLEAARHSVLTKVHCRLRFWARNFRPAVSRNAVPLLSGGSRRSPFVRTSSPPVAGTGACPSVRR